MTLAVLVSGSGTILEAILEAGIAVDLVVSYEVPPESVEVVLAVRAIAGDAPAYRLHRALLAHRGQVAGQDALAALADLKLDRAAVEERADSEEIIATLKKHVAISRALGMEATPSFAVNGMGIAGWPGAKTLARVVKNVRACDQIAC